MQRQIFQFSGSGDFEFPLNIFGCPSVLVSAKVILTPYYIGWFKNKIKTFGRCFDNATPLMLVKSIYLYCVA